MDQDIKNYSVTGNLEKEMQKNLLSIVIPCYNDYTYITTAVNSALKQTWQYKEIIIVDDGSSIRTQEVLKKFKSKEIRVITQNNQGPSAARNRGIQSASGKYILVLDSDDFFEPIFSQKAIEIIDSRANIKIVTCYGRWFVSENKSLIHKPSGGNIENFLYKCGAFGSTLFLKEDWERVNGYDEAMKLGYEDWEFYIRVLEGGGEVIVIPEVLFHYRNKKDSRNSLANNKKYEIWKYIYLKHNKLYINDFERFVSTIIYLLQQQDEENRRLRNKPDFRIGYYLLLPIRKIKLLLFPR